MWFIQFSCGLIDWDKWLLPGPDSGHSKCQWRIQGGGGGVVGGFNPPQKKNHYLIYGFPYDLVIYWVRNSAQYALDSKERDRDTKIERSSRLT